jgi:hypothetical protein
MTTKKSFVTPATALSWADTEPEQRTGDKAAKPFSLLETNKLERL